MAACWSIILVFMTLWCYCSCNSFPVPLLIWSSKSVDVNDEILAGHTLNYEDIQDKYLDKLTSQPNTICVFVQDKLSIDDFAAHQSNQLKNLKYVLSVSSTSIILPSVILRSQFDDNKLVKYFERKGNEKNGNVISLSPKDIPNFGKMIKELKSDELNIIIIHLPSTQSEEHSVERNLVASDDVIGKISKELKNRFPDYVGLLTANMPRDDIMLGMEENREISHVRSRRDIEGDGKRIGCGVTGVLVQSRGHHKLYFRNIILGGNNTEIDFLKTNQSLVLIASSLETKHNKTLEFDIPPKSFKNESKITLSFLFKLTGPYWSCANIKVTGTLFNNPSIKIDDSFDCSSDTDINILTHMDVPSNRSFACDYYSIRGDYNTTMNLTGFQVDPQQTSNISFSNSVNCIGFFTPPIWMGLLTVGVLVAILYGGVLSLLSIKCMDRFDNPNDQTIVINNE